MKKTLLFAGISILFVAETLRLYLLMPFQGSQQMNIIALSYFLYHQILIVRIIAFAFIIAGFYDLFLRRKKRTIILCAALMVFYAIFFFAVVLRFVPEKLFPPINDPKYLYYQAGTIDAGRPIIGVTINGESKAYPVDIVAYHHLVPDTIGGEPVIITYCSACHTARVYSSELNGSADHFRIVGMSFLNLIIEDARTKSWWQQATGYAIAGPLKGTTLREVPFSQVSLSAWGKKHPGTLILQADAAYADGYAQLGGLARGGIRGTLDKHDNAPWQPKSWVIGIKTGSHAKAYDWNTLLVKQVIDDSIANVPVVLVLEPDKKTYHAWKRRAKGKTLQFTLAGNKLEDSTNSVWNFDGTCVSGSFAGEQLEPLSSSQEFWHSWKQFNPETLQSN